MPLSMSRTPTLPRSKLPCAGLEGSVENCSYSDSVELGDRRSCGEEISSHCPEVSDDEATWNPLPLAPGDCRVKVPEVTVHPSLPDSKSKVTLATCSKLLSAGP